MFCCLREYGCPPHTRMCWRLSRCLLMPRSHRAPHTLPTPVVQLPRQIILRQQRVRRVWRRSLQRTGLENDVRLIHPPCRGSPVGIEVCPWYFTFVDQSRRHASSDLSRDISAGSRRLTLEHDSPQRNRRRLRSVNMLPSPVCHTGCFCRAHATQSLSSKPFVGGTRVNNCWFTLMIGNVLPLDSEKFDIRCLRANHDRW